MTQSPLSGSNVDLAVVTPTDRVRWGPILAGVFAAVSTVLVLSVLGAAIAGTAYDPGDDGRWFGIGAGIWGAVTMLLAFLVGGMLAARTAAVQGHHNGVLNGAMVWVVAIPLMLYFFAGALGNVASSAANAAGDAAATAMQVDRADATTAGGAVGDARSAAARIDVPSAEAVAERGGQAAWWTLVSLLLGLTAAAAGGYFGTRTVHRRDARQAHAAV